MHPDTPEDGLTLEQLFANTTVNVEQMLVHLRGIANTLGLAFGDRHYTYNSRLAQELGLWAETKGLGHEYHMAAFLAYFAHGKNLAKTAVLLDIIEQLGLDRDEADRILHERTFRKEVDAEWELSRNLRITAVPTFVVNDATLTGAQPYNDLLRFIQGSVGDLERRV